MLTIIPDFDVKDPNAASWPKGIDWTTYLARIDAGETIASSSWAITGKDTALTFVDDSIVVGNKQTQLRLNGGTRGRKYTITNSIVTSSGVAEDGSFQILIQDT